MFVLTMQNTERNSQAAFAEKQKESKDDLSLILEVEGNPHEHKKHIEKFYPNIEVVAVYEKLFKGLAIQGKPAQLNRLRSLDFVQAEHPVQTYKASQISSQQSSIEKKQLSALSKQDEFIFPNKLNDTKFTGKGIKVGVVDTGIDYTHPDLAKNFKGGYDAVDLDKDPMETLPEQGIPTLHGSHVAGIIAANGNLQGVAPDAELYGYRALGPGGSGTSVQVIAAMEEAVKDGVDIMNLSLGNTVNGPDYPTSLAVNRAEELGVLVVVANGNDGPNNWTVGSPATATHALGVGASSHSQKVPVLEETLFKRKFPVTLLAGSVPWSIERGAYIADGDDPEANLTGSIALMKRGNKIPFAEKALEAQSRGAQAVLIYNNEPGTFQGSVEEYEGKLVIPTAALSKSSGEWLQGRLVSKGKFYLNARTEVTQTGMAGFSSRGPVATNWTIKPDLVAPGTSIVSTVPNGYEALQGTSMAAPHAAGVAALLKEAHPKWSNKQIVGAMKTTAKRLENEKSPLQPITQGMGQVQPNAAIHAEVIIEESLLSFGKISKQIDKRKTSITLENITNRTQEFNFRIPKKEQGLTWHLPQSFRLAANEKKTIDLSLDVYSEQIKEGIQQGWLELVQSSGQSIHLPYMFINKAANDPKASGLEFSMKPFSKNEYSYQLYLGDDIRRAEVSLYNPDTLVRQQKLLEIADPLTGMNKGEVKANDIPPEGVYLVLITVELEDKSLKTYESWLEIG